MQRAVGALTDSPVTRRLPAAMRDQLHAALLQRSSQNRSLAEIAQEFELDRYGVTPDMLAAHAEHLDTLIRPVVSAQIVAGVLGCLPPSVRTRLLAGSQVLLLSSVFTALSESAGCGIQAGELMKFASVLRAAAQAQRRRESVRRGQGKRAAARRDDDALYDHQRIARAVRTLYGLPWPPGEETGLNSAPAPHP